MSEEPGQPAAAPAPATPPLPESAAPPPAWQPFTFRGVAAFARAPFSRLFMAQFITAAVAAAVAAWFFGRCYSPVITQAAAKLPPSAGMTNGGLTGFPDILNSETKFLSIAVAQDRDDDLGQFADLQITLRQNHLQIASLLSSAFGSVNLHYNTTCFLDLSRTYLDPLWGAWQPVAEVAVALATAILAFTCWFLLATLYAPAAKFVAWFGDRRLSWTGAWRLTAAALLPGALLLSAGLLLYGWQQLDVFGLAFFAAMHFVVGWCYALVAPAFAPPRSPKCAQANPFRT